MVDIIYVDTGDNVIGSGPSREAHEKSIIHRVIRIYLYNAAGEILLQKRADHLNSNPGLWAESVAGHVDVGETYREAAYREMKEEIGVEEVELTELKKVYTEEKDAHKTKKRFTTLYRGAYDGDIRLEHGGEVSEVKWVAPEVFRQQISQHPERFSDGTIQCFKALEE